MTYACDQSTIVEGGSKVADDAKHEGDDTADDEEPRGDGKAICVL